MEKWIGSKERTPIIHLAILREPYLQYIIDGKKTIESRCTKNRCPPFRMVSPGDIIYMKKSGGLVLARAIAGMCSYFENFKPQPSIIKELFKRYNDSICAEPEFIQDKLDSLYISLIHLEKVERINPFEFKQKGQQAWFVNWTPNDIVSEVA